MNTDNPYHGATDEELQESETQLLASAGSHSEPISWDRYERHYEHIRRVRRANDSTHKRLSKRIKGESLYEPSRAALQSELVAEFIESKLKLPAEGKAVLVGGITGSGKSTTLAGLPEIQDRYALVNPDEVKYSMAIRAMTPDIPGVLPLETDELIKYEAQLLSERVLQALVEARVNLVIDRTLNSENQILKTLETLRAGGYSNLEGVFVDVAPEDALERIRVRHKRGLDEHLMSGKGFGERPVPGNAVTATYTDHPEFRSKNLQAFVSVAKNGAFNSTPRIYDSSAGNEEVTAKYLA